VVVPLQLGGNPHLGCFTVLVVLEQSLGYLGLVGILSIEPPLLHGNLACRETLLTDVDAWLRHVLVDNLREQLYVPVSVYLHALDEAVVAGLVEKLADVLQLDFDDLRLSVGDQLQFAHVFEFAVDGVFLGPCNGGVLETGNEFGALVDLAVVVRQIHVTLSKSQLHLFLN